MQNSLLGDYWWSSNILGYRISGVDGVSTDYVVGDGTVKVFTDSASVCNYIPKAYFDDFGKRLGIFAGNYTVDNSLGYLIDCSK